MNSEIMEKLMHDDRTEIVNLMIEYTNLAQKYNKLLAEIMGLIDGKDYSDDVSTYDIQEAIKRATLS